MKSAQDDRLLSANDVINLMFKMALRLIKRVYKGYVHTKPDKFENATFFIPKGLPSTLKRRFWCPKTELFENALQSG